jgi:ATP-dependent DNA helicase DinG
LSNSKIPEKYFVIDFENTGGKLEKGHKITAVGIVIVEKVREQFIITKKFSKFIDPERSIDPFVERLIGITNRKFAKGNYPLIDEVFSELEELFGNDKVFVAHGMHVDYGMYNFIYKEKYGKDLKCIGIDTHKIAKNLLGYPKCSIGVLYENYDIQGGKHHEPDFDAEVSANILIEGLNKIQSKNLDIGDYLIPLPKKKK